MTNVPLIKILSQYLFDDLCKENGINDGTVDKIGDTAFISIIGTDDVLKYHLEEPDTKHWFQDKHDNVLNLEFDDLPCDEFTFDGHVAKGLSMQQAKEIYDFVEKNLGKNFIIHCRAGMSRSAAVGWYVRDFYKDIYKGEYELPEGPNKDVYVKLSRVYYKEKKIYDEEGES